MGRSKVAVMKAPGLTIVAFSTGLTATSVGRSIACVEKTKRQGEASALSARSITPVICTV